MPFCAPRLVENAPRIFENTSFAASSSSSLKFSLRDISSSPSIHSLTALTSRGVTASIIFAFMSPLTLTLATARGGLMPSCPGASYSFLSPTPGVLPVSPSIVAFISFAKILKNSFISFVLV